MLPGLENLNTRFWVDGKELFSLAEGWKGTGLQLVEQLHYSSTTLGSIQTSDSLSSLHILPDHVGFPRVVWFPSTSKEVCW